MSDVRVLVPRRTSYVDAEVAQATRFDLQDMFPRRRLQVREKTDLGWGVSSGHAPGCSRGNCLSQQAQQNARLSVGPRSAGRVPVGQAGPVRTHGPRCTTTRPGIAKYVYKYMQPSTA